MTKKPALRVLDAIAAEPWAITEAGLRTIIEIASRETDIEAVEARLGRPLENTRNVTIRDGVAVIPTVGPIAQRANLFTRVSGATSVQDLATDFATSYEDPNVRAVVFAGDGPGGTVHIAEVARLIFERDARFPNVRRKPVQSHISGSGASALFWLIAATDKRYATETSSVGCLGTVLEVRRPAAPKEGAESSFEIVYSKTPKKRINVESEEGKAQLQTWADDVGDVFIANVAEFMGISEEKVLADFGQGDMLIASKALAAGMIDGIATLEEVIADLSAKTRTGSYISPRIAASTTKENSMDPKAIRASLGLPETASDEEVTSKLSSLSAANAEAQALIASQAKSLEHEARTRITAEVESFKAPLLAKDDLRFNAQSVGIFATLLLVAKSAAAGLTSAMVAGKEIALDAKTLGAFVAEQVAAMTSASAKFEVPEKDLEKAADKQKATGGVTADDFKVVAINAEASKKINAAVRERQKTDPKFTREMLRAEVLGK